MHLCNCRTQPNIGFLFCSVLPSSLLSFYIFNLYLSLHSVLFSLSIFRYSSYPHFILLLLSFLLSSLLVYPFLFFSLPLFSLLFFVPILKGKQASCKAASQLHRLSLPLLESLRNHDGNGNCNAMLLLFQNFRFKRFLFGFSFEFASLERL